VSTGPVLATSSITAAERAAFEHAIDMARMGLGSTKANPCVGAVVLDRDGAVVGTGRTEPHSAVAAGRHAEVVALDAAGERARGGTLVCTLEPCNGTGRTGPCVEVVLAAGVARLVYAVTDPLPRFGGGAARLAAAGVAVLHDLPADLMAAARTVHRPWLVAAGRGWPYVTVKLAASLDGRAAAADGSSQWITSVAARADAQLLRSRVDAIVVGSGTVLADDPHLTVRGTPELRTPLRVVLDTRGRVPATARVLDEAAPTLLVREGHDLPRLTRRLCARHGVRHLLVEGGPAVAGSFLAAGLVDEVVAYLAPALLGDGPAAVVTRSFPTIADAVRLVITDVTRVGPDVRLTADVQPAGNGQEES